MCSQAFASEEAEIYLYFKEKQLKNKPKTKGFIIRKVEKQILEHFKNEIVVMNKKEPIHSII